MAWRHTLTITRTTGTVVQDADTGAIIGTPAVTTVYDGKGTLLHDHRTKTRTEDRDPELISSGTLYLKSRKLVWSIKQGDVVNAYDLKLKIDLTARVDSIDSVVGMLKVSDIRLLDATVSGYGENYGNDYGGA